LTFSQIAEIYGEGGPVTSWSQLGVTVPGCDEDEIIRASRLDSSGTRRHLQRLLLASGQEFRQGSIGVQGSKSMVELVSQTPCAIGYVGLAYAPPARVKVVCVAPRGGEACIVPSMQSAVDETYPLARPLLMVKQAGKEAELEAYLSWILSDAGQCLLREAGYAPYRPVACP
jgi:phosphate transport system substrate-binding protein